MPGEMVQMVVEVDNSNCSANIKYINIGIQKTVSMRSGSSGTQDRGNIYTKSINGIPAKVAKIVLIYFILG
jgi:hypothetical protein